MLIFNGAGHDVKITRYGSNVGRILSRYANCIALSSIYRQMMQKDCFYAVEHKSEDDGNSK